MSVDKLIDDATRAARAKDLIDSELLNEAFKELEDAYVKHWRTSNIDNEKGREKLFLAINVVGKVKEHLAKVLEDGRLAQAELHALAAEKKEWHRV